MHPEDIEGGNVSTIFKTTIKYVDTRIDLFKLQVVKKISENLSSVFAKIIAMLFFLLAIVLLSIAGAIWLGKLFGGMEYGFLAVGGFFVLVGIIFFIFKTPFIKVPISNALIQKGLK